MNPSTAFATVFTDELARCGLREAVLAPGSRSAPLALALYDRAEAGRPPGPALRLHVRIDERSAAFLALGLAKASRRPVALVCTSGTAAAHFHPAVIEADESGVPLLVLTVAGLPRLGDGVGRRRRLPGSGARQRAAPGSAGTRRREQRGRPYGRGGRPRGQRGQRRHGGLAGIPRRPPRRLPVDEFRPRPP